MIGPKIINGSKPQSYYVFGGQDPLRFSPNGKWLAHIYRLGSGHTDTLELFEFNNLTGSLKLKIRIALHDSVYTPYGAYYSMEFSPCSNKLYMASTHPDNNYQVICSYDLKTNDSLSIINSRKILRIFPKLKYLFFGSQITPQYELFIFNDDISTIKNFDSITYIRNLCDSMPVIEVSKFYNNSRTFDDNLGWLNFPNFISSYFHIQHSSPSGIVEYSPNLVTPNIFTPNNDNINDYFSIQISGYTHIEYYIYNRWGNLIGKGRKDLNAQIKTEEPVWDGKYKGEEVPAGVYFFLIKATKMNNEAETKKGFIQLLR